MESVAAPGEQKLTERIDRVAQDRYAVHLEFAFSGDDGGVAGYAARFGVGHRLLKAEAPNGNPSVEFTGTWFAVRDLLAAYVAESYLPPDHAVSLQAAIQSTPEPGEPFIGYEQYGAVAKAAQLVPGQWVTLRHGGYSPNVVADQRRGRIPELPPKRFEARAIRERNDLDRATWTCEVRTATDDSVPFAQAIRNVMHASVNRLPSEPFPEPAAGTSNAEIADMARRTPGVWVTARRGMSSANFVTDLRRGRYPDLPPDEFQARSLRLPDPHRDGRRVYTIEVLYSPTRRIAVDDAVRAGVANSGLTDVLAEASVQRLITSVAAQVAALLRRHGIEPN